MTKFFTMVYLLILQKSLHSFALPKWDSQVVPLVKNPPAIIGDIRDAALISGSGTSPEY